jgi:PIN domain nuclease of toxin-antitoxin system
LTNDRRLGQTARRILGDETSRLIVPTITLADLKHLADAQRVPYPFESIMRSVMADARCHIYPLDIFAVLHLPTGLDIHDTLIVATGLFYRTAFNEDVSIITADNAIRASGLLPVIW